MSAHPSYRSAARVGTAASIASTVIAIGNLPAAELPIGWLLAFTVPAAILGSVQVPEHRAARAVFGLLLQTAACLLAIWFAPALTRPAALACTVLPPLAFATARRRESDAALALFLGFCVIVVGVILDGVAPLLIVGWVIAACVALRCATIVGTHRAASASARNAAIPATARTALFSAIVVAMPCLLAAMAVEQVLSLLPSPSRGAIAVPPAVTGAPRRVGLDDVFVIEGATKFGDESDEQKVRVRTTTGTAVPRDLYLRSASFAVAGFGRWGTGRIVETRTPGDGAVELREAAAGVATSWLTIERSGGARSFFFVLPGTVEIRGTTDLLVDAARESVREARGATNDVYRVGWQVHPPLGAGAPWDPGARTDELLALPIGIDRAPYEALLAEWNVPADAVAAAETIAAGLSRRCVYERAEPVGPHRHAIENFLFAPRDRRGYCVHFASAAALLLRMRGIPCRLGVGYHGGDLDYTDRRGRLFSSRHAHAWVEIPFADRGFAVFDPTPPAERGIGASVDLGADEEPEPAPPEAPGNPLLALLVKLLREPWLPAIALVLVVAAAQWPRRKRRPATATPAPAAASQARRRLVRLLQALARAGHPRTRGVTLEVFTRSLAAQQRLPRDVDVAFATYQEVRFGGRPFDPPRQSSLDAGIAAANALVPVD